MASFIDFENYQLTECRMPECEWSGHFTNIEEHFKLYHPQQIREIHHDSYFQLTFEDLRQKHPLLLSTYSGLYWFAQNDKKQQKGHFSRGIFAIGASKPVEYHIKLGQFSTKIVDMLGPFQSRPERSNQYDFDMKTDYMKYLVKTMSHNVVIFFGEFEDNADEYRYENLTSQDRCDINAENFFCGACARQSQGAPFFCKNRHSLCEECFEIVISADCPECNLDILEALYSLQTTTTKLQKVAYRPTNLC